MKSLNRASLCTLFSLILLVKEHHALHNEKCVLPTLEKVNWDKLGKLNGIWYNTLNTQDPIMETIPCFALKNFQSTSEGGKVDYQGFKPSADGTLLTYMFSQLWSEGDNSIVQSEENQGLSWREEVKYFGANDGAQEELNELTGHRLSIVTDYNHYIMHLECGPDGKHYIWIDSRNKNPTAEDILRIHNKIVLDLGGDWSHVPLYLSGCTNLNIP